MQTDIYNVQNYGIVEILEYEEIGPEINWPLFLSLNEKSRFYA